LICEFLEVLYWQIAIAKRYFILSFLVIKVNIHIQLKIGLIKHGMNFSCIHPVCVTALFHYNISAAKIYLLHFYLEIRAIARQSTPTRSFAFHTGLSRCQGELMFKKSNFWLNMYIDFWHKK